jgi:hypothetical protein
VGPDCEGGTDTLVLFVYFNRSTISLMSIGCFPGVNDVQARLIRRLAQILQLHCQQQLIVGQAAQLQLIHALAGREAAAAATQLLPVPVLEPGAHHQLGLAHLVRPAVPLERGEEGAARLRLIEDGVAIHRGEARSAVVAHRRLLLDEGVGEGEADRGLEVRLRVGEVAEEGGALLPTSILQ